MAVAQRPRVRARVGNQPTGPLRTAGHEARGTRVASALPEPEYPKTALVVDDVVRVGPGRVRGGDIRGEAAPLAGPHGLGPGLSEEVVRIRRSLVPGRGREEAASRSGPVRCRP
ncbi:hypothetical protein Shyhy01_05770 [Streptomyces hygroscopicus subsp. hygroscopicus]|nr:hypothetical protein Shyhy01_05770 [Streptomyces hygroscopicus subsp. hygroscopicus]